MRIAMLAPFEEPVPPKRYGGTERVVFTLTEQLVKAGHDVVLLATGDSSTSAKLEPIFPAALRTLPEMKEKSVRDSFKYIGIGRVLDFLSENRFDVLHNHIGWRMLPFEKIVGMPVVTTLHGPLNINHQDKYYQLFSGANYVSISLKQREPLPQLNYIANVYNGIEVDRFSPSYETGEYLAFLGRMSPEKGPLQAIEIAKKSGETLMMAAKVDAVDEEYFTTKIEPLIDGRQIKFLGEVDHKEKVDLLRNAKALVAPIQWEEPFGLYFVEAMACGTPVVALRRGSVPEIIINEETGYICDDLEEMIQCVGEIGRINRRRCREHVEKHFTPETMMLGYLDAYRKATQAYSVLKNLV